MLKRVQIENYRCFRQVDVPLKPLTVLVGENNTGKSSFLSAIANANAPLHEHLFPASDRGTVGTDVPTRVVLTSEDGDSFAILPRSPNEAERQLLRHEMTGYVLPMRCFGFESLAPTLHSVGTDEAMGIPSINNDADNVAAFLDSLLRRDRPRFQRILEKLRSLIPGFDDFTIETPNAALRKINLRWNNGSDMSGDLASDGVKLMIFFVALAEDPSPPRLILLEEPENGVHPRALQDIVDQLIGLSEGRHADRPTQVILTTHSPYLLDFIDPTKHQVLVSQLQADGSRTVTPVDEERLKVFLDEFKLGEVWFNEGETGLLEKGS